MNKLSIVKAPTGFGKTFGYVNVALSNNSNSKLVVAPTNALKDEIYNEVVKNFGTDNVKKTPILEKLKDKEMQEVIEKFDKMGLFSTKKKYLNRKMKELETKRKDGTITETESIDLINIKNYIRENEKVNNFEGHVISTHERLFYFSQNFFKKHTVIIDEDIIKTMLKIRKVSMGQLLDLSTFSNQFQQIFTNKIFSIHSAPYKQTLQAPPMKVKSSEIEKVLKDGEFDFDVMGFINSCCYWKYNPNKEIMKEHKELAEKNEVSPKYNRNDEIYFLEKRELPNADIVIFSATIEPIFYKSLLFRDDIEMFDIGEVKIKGKIEQHITSTCSRNDLKVHPEKIKKIVDKYPQIPPQNQITFLKFSNENSDLHFGNTEGKNCLQGQDILVVGTPHCNEAVYKLYAYVLTQYQTNFSDEQMRFQEIEYHKCKFWFNTYDNKFLRNVQLWYINSELEQAVGRARILRNKCTVYLYSNFPMKQTIYIDDNLEE